MYDEETGLYYLQSRYYDPETCRFIASDVLLSTGQGVIGCNSFAYCGNQPVNCIDKNGTFADWVNVENTLAITGLLAAVTVVTILAVVGTPFTGGLSVAGGAAAASALVATAVTVAETSAVVGLISIFTASTIEIARNTSSVIGSSGTQTSSTTTWKGDGKERIDVENPNPGIRDGNIHYHDSGNMKYYYDITKKVFKNVTPRLKKLIQNRAFQNGIKKALNILGE